MSDHTALDAEIERLEFDYMAEFVPQNVSRNRDKKEPSLNWRITLKRRAANTRALMLEYTQGIAHVPGYQKWANSREMMRHGHSVREFFEGASHSGQYPDKYHRELPLRMCDLPKPELRDILYSLVMDSDVLESSGFEDWARNFGYDTDSRKAEAMYKDCIEQSLQFKALVGQENLDKLRELYQGY